MKVNGFCLLFFILCLEPCHAAHLQQVETGDGNDFVASFSKQNNSLYYARSDLQFTYSQIRYSSLITALPQKINLPTVSSYRFFTSPNVVEIAGQEYLYYVAAEKFWGHKAQLLRVPLNSTETASQVQLPMNYGAYSLLRIISMSDGQLALTLRSGRSRLFYSLSADGIEFGPAVFVAVGTMPALAEFADGTLLMSYQSGQSIHQMRGQIRISVNKGILWSEATELPHKGNVHDLYPVKRKDGNLDIYYSVAGLNDRMTLYRICLNSQLQFGSSEPLLAAQDVNVAKSAMFYTVQGRLLSFSNQSDDLRRTNLTLYPLGYDAPHCPSPK
jgi:hypothetical protein